MKALTDRITQQMSLRQPQEDAVHILDEIGVVLDFKSAPLDSVASLASDKSRLAKPVQFDTAFPSFCFALATGVGKTRLMGAHVYYLWKQKGYRNFFILTPGMTIYEKLRAELSPAHPKYLFVGLSDFPQPEVYDGDSYLRFRPGQIVHGNPANIFLFNIGKIFTPQTDRDFKFHRFNEMLGESFANILKAMDDLVVIMDESHRYRGAASLEAINHLKPVLGLEYTATPKYKKNVVYSFSLAQAIGHYVKTPTVVTRTNMTLSDAAEIEKLKLKDGMTRHEQKKQRLAEYCTANNLPSVKPFVLISTRDTQHAGEIKEFVESETFHGGVYKGKAIIVHSKQTGAESEENVQRLLSVEQPTSDVEIVIHVNMLKEGWDVKNLCTIIPLRASVSEILTEQTIGRGLRLPFGQLTQDTDLDALEIISHDQYKKLIEEAKDSPLFKFRELTEEDLRPVRTVPVKHDFLPLEGVLPQIAATHGVMFTSDLADEKRLNTVVQKIVAEEVKKAAAPVPAGAEAPATGVPLQQALFPEHEGQPSAAQKINPAELEARLKDLLRRYVHANIDVPQIRAETTTARELEPFDLKANAGPFTLVDQRILAHELASGKEHEGEKLEVLEVENPRAFLAGRVIEAVAELDATNDKTAVLALVDKYIEKMGTSQADLGKIAHLYRDAITNDIKTQIEAHIRDHTEVKLTPHRGFVAFKPYSKTVLAKDGIVHYNTQVPRGDVRRYLFEGFSKSFYPQVPFDSAPEKDLAAILERDKTVLKWVRPPDGNVPIYYGGRPYNPDFIVETAKRKLVIEVKARKDVQPMTSEVKEKGLAAIRWCEAASKIPGAPKPWEYKLVPDDVIDSTRDLDFILGQAVVMP